MLEGIQNVLNKLKAERDKLQADIDLIEDDATEKDNTLYDLKERFKHTKEPPKYATGIRSLDNGLGGGFTKGTFINIVSASGVGKSTLVLKILSNIGAYNKTLFFNYEMSERRINDRTKMLEDKTLSNMIIKSGNSNIDFIVSTIRRLAKEGVTYIVIDSKMKITTADSDEYKSSTEISKKLSKASQENDVIIILINQISESDIKSGRLGIKGSGGQIYDTDVALFLLKDDDSEGRILVCSKNRDGNTFKTNLPFDEVSMIKNHYEIKYNNDMEMPKL